VIAYRYPVSSDAALALAGVAFGHAMDMAAHEYFEHEDLSGRSPAERVQVLAVPRG
jgi:uncharacterized protein YkwD